MSLSVKETGSIKMISPGTYPGRCVRVIDIGTQHSNYQGKEMVKKQVIISWELPNEIIPDGDYAGMPYMVSKFYTASLHEKANLRKDLEAWRGKSFTASELEGFDLKKVIGAPCMLSVIHDNDKTKINAVMALPKGMELIKQISESIFFDIDEWNDENFNKLTDGIKKIIMKADEYKFPNEGVDHDNAPPIGDDDIPF
jgi:hypothetical protein